MGKYIHYTKEQIDQANQMDLKDFLEKKGYLLKRSGKESIWEGPNGSVSIHGNCWYHQYDQEGGYAINFLMRFFDMSFQEAMELYANQEVVPFAEEPKEEEKKEFVLPEKGKNMKRLFAYLCKERHIHQEIVQFFVKEDLLYQSKDYHNAVFVGIDEEGIPRHAHKRGTSSNSKYRGNVLGSDPRYSFHFVGTSPKVYVFEAPIDMLSFLSLRSYNWQNHSYIALCSVSSAALFQLLKTNPYLKEVYLCLDCDKAGIEGNYRIREQLQKSGDYTVVMEPLWLKDWNEALKAVKRLSAEEGTGHPGLIRMEELCKETVQGCEGVRIKDLFGNIKTRVEALEIKESMNEEAIREQATELSWLSFLFGKSKCESAGKNYHKLDYAERLLGRYQPHHDYGNYKKRILEIKEQWKKIEGIFGNDQILLEPAFEQAIDEVFTLSVDCMRLVIYTDAQIQKKKVSEMECQMSPC